MRQLFSTKIPEILLPLKKILVFNFINVYTLHNLWVFSAAALFIYLSFLLGDLLLRLTKIDFFTAVARIVYRILIGFGLFGLAGLLLGLAGYFDVIALRLFALAVVLASYRVILVHLGMLYRRTRDLGSVFMKIKEFYLENMILKLIISFWLTINLFIVFVPLTGYDAMDYHLPIMADLIQQKKLSFSSATASYSSTHVFAEIIYATPMAIFNNTFPKDISILDLPKKLRDRIPIFNGTAAPYIFQLLQFGFLILFLLLIYDFLRERVRNKFLVSIALLATLSLMDLQREVMHGGYIDVLVFLFGIASTFIIIDNMQRNEISFRGLNIAALFLGFALGAKSIALFFLAIDAVFLFMLFMRHSFSFSDIIKQAAKYALIILAVSGFWYAKNFFWFGNPVYPMFSDKAFGENVGLFIMQRNFLNFFLFPFYRFGQWFVNPDETGSHLLVLGYFALLYPLIILVVALRKRLSLSEAMIFIFIELYLLFSFLVTHQIRFMLPAIMFLPALLVLLADDLLQYFADRQNSAVSHALPRSLYVTSVAVFLILTFGFIHYFNIRFDYITGIYNQNKYVDEIGWQ